MDYFTVAVVVVLLALVGAMVWYQVAVLPEVRAVAQQLAVCNCSAVCAGKVVVNPNPNATVYRIEEPE